MPVRRRHVLALALGGAALTGGILLALAAGGGDDEPVAAAPTSTTTTSRATTSTTAAPTSTTSTSAVPTTATTAPATTLVPTTATTSAPAPPFRSSIASVTAAQLGSSWKPGMGCPGPEKLRMLEVSHWGYDGQVRQGRIVVAASQAERIVAVFRDVYAARFPIERMVPIDSYGGDDQASMRANNTSGFNCRYVAGTTKLSQHGLGLAVDVNPLVNPYVKGGTVDPPEGAPYADRDQNVTGMIHAGDAVVDAFARQGWGWGGYWSSGQDYQHFSASGG